MNGRKNRIAVSALHTVATVTVDRSYTRMEWRAGVQAKEQAEKLKRWLIVNIQCSSEFDSHRLNRDVWPELKEIVQENFVFWQVTVRPVPVQMWQGWVQSRCRCGVAHLQSLPQRALHRCIFAPTAAPLGLRRYGNLRAGRREFGRGS